MIDTRTPDYSSTPVAPNRPRFNYVAAVAGQVPCATIVTPFYNTGELFHETAQSVFGQSFQQWEWLIVNDGSTQPDALAILAGYRNADPRVRVIDHPVNRGPSASRNTGIRAGRTPYVALLDSDDLLEPTAIEKWFWHLATVPAHAAVNGFGVGFGALEYLWTVGFHQGAKLLDENLIVTESMIRREVHAAVGGFDETIQGGLEDWEFWLKCAAHGYWGATIAEFLTWYRRRPDHTDRWPNLEDRKLGAFRKELRKRYPHLWEGKFPQVAIPSVSYAPITEDLPATNVLEKRKQRLLLVVPWLAMGGADKFNLDMSTALTHRGWEISIATTLKGDHSWLPVFERVTPDIFPLSHFLRLEDYPRFLSYLITSRQIDSVLISNSELGYRLLPSLRAKHPHVAFADYCHMEEEGWNNGGYPRMAAQFQEQLDLNIVSSEYLKGWLTRRGADPDRVAVCTINIDVQQWHPDPVRRSIERRMLTIPEQLPVILYPCRIAEQKQPQVFLETLRAVRAHHGSFMAVVAGDGPYLPRMKERAAAYGLSDIVRFLGAVSNERVQQLMTMADILFLPSKWEGIALALFEAMASGVAVVGAAVGGQSELVTAGTGILIAPSDPETETREYAKIILSLLENPERITELKKAGRDRVMRHFTIERMEDRIASLCQEILRRHVDQPRPPIPVGLARSTAAEAIEMQRIDPKRLWYSGLTDAAQSVLEAVHTHVNAGDYVAAVILLEALQDVFAGADDTKRVAMIQTQIARLKNLQVSAGRKSGDGLADPLVSVVIPCYKQAAFLADAMMSVLSQTYEKWEMIVVNDGSPDDTSDVVRKFQERYPGRAIRLIEQPNRGLSAARNAGFAASRGVFCVPLDADDLIAPSFIVLCLEEMRKDDRIGFVYTHMKRFGEISDVYELPPFDANTIVHQDNTAAVCALIRRTMWNEVGGYNEQMKEGYEDWDFWIGCIEKGWKGACIAEPLFEYRVKHRGMLRNANMRRPYLIARIVTNHPSLYDERTRKWASEETRKYSLNASDTPATSMPPLRICYLVHNLLGITGGNQTLLQQANALVARGYDVTIVSYSEPPDWMTLAARVIRIHPGMSMARAVPPSDVAIGTYFLNAMELPNVDAPVKIYFAQGDQFAFTEPPADQTQAQLHKISVASYGLAGVTVVANSNALARRIKAITGRTVDGILPVCVDSRIFHPLGRQQSNQPPRILVVGPDAAGTALEPLAFKGISDIRAALEILLKEGIAFRVVRISNTPQEIFKDFPCEFHQTPDDATKTELYGSADLLVYASHYDSCPRPPLEAMAAGVPVVCTSSEGAKEYCVDGENSLLVPIQSPVDLSAAVRRLLSDEGLRSRLIQKGVSTAEKRPVEREWNALEELIKKETAESGRHYHIPAVPRPLISVIVLLSVQQQSEAAQFLDEVERGITESHEVILVDLDAGEDVRTWMLDRRAVKGSPVIVRSGTWNYAQACNSAFRVACGEILCVVRDGCHLPDHWCDSLAHLLRGHTAIGIVAPVVVSREGVGGKAVDCDEDRKVFQGRRFPLRTAPDACVMFRSSLLGWAGVMNESSAAVENEPAGFLYRAMLTGCECVAAGDVVFRRKSDEGDGGVVRQSRLFCPSAVWLTNPGDSLEGFKRAVLVALDEARTLEFADRVNEAALRLQSEIEHFPESPALRAALAWLLLRFRQFESVSALIGQTPESVKRDPQWLLIAGFAMEGLGELALARQCANKALALNPESAPAHLLLGMVALDEGDGVMARDHVDKAIALDPGYGEAHAQRGALLWAQGARDEGRSSLERAFVLFPTHPEIIDAYCQTIEGDDHLMIALRYIEDARQFFPDHKRLASWHITFLASLGRTVEAAAEAASALGTFGPDEALLDVALALRSHAGPMVTSPGLGITLCMIVKNAEQDLARCLGSMRDSVDEIVVVDTGSTDHSPRIAEAMGAHVIRHTWQDDFADARNAGLEQADGAWILVLDADEVIAPKEGALLRRMVTSIETPHAGIVFTTRNYVREMDLQGWQRNDGQYAEERGTGWIGSDKVRLFPNRPDIRYRHAVHEIVEESLQRAGIPLVRTEIPVHHYGRMDAERTRRKAEHYVAMGRKKLAAGTLNDARSIIELAAQEQELGNHGEAVALWHRFLDLHPGTARAELGLGVSLCELDRWVDGRAFLAKAMVHDPALREAPVKYSLAALHCGDSRDAREVLEDFCARHSEYPFGHLALAATLACEQRMAEALAHVRAVEQRQIRSRGFFRNLSLDLLRAGQQMFGDRVAALFPEQENA